MNQSGVNMNNIIDEVIQLLENCKSAETRWLESLPIYNCPSCNKETIFESGCLECEDENGND